MNCVSNKLAAFAFAACLSAASASAATFDFSGASAASAAKIFGPIDGVSVTATAGSYAFDTILDTGGQLVTQNANGLGVDCPALFGGGGSVLCPDEIDGFLDLLTLTFSEEVAFQSLLFSEVDEDDDFDLFIDGALVASEVNIASENPFLFAGGLRGTSLSIGADAGTFSNLNEDDFRLASVSASVAPVPAPAALPLLATALGCGALVRRRRRATS